jgi:sulfopyruvate decarboxylase TPP-binding subunit
MIATMRGEEGEFNPWQVPMGSAIQAVLEAMGVRVLRAREAGEVASMVRAGIAEAYEEDAAVAILVSQAVIGIKSFQEQRNR